MPRPHGRAPDRLRDFTLTRHFTGNAPGSVLVKAGRTTVLCTCSIEPKVPDFLAGKNRGWLTAEYGMLPGSTPGRKPRDKAGKVDGRAVEIQRLIGRSLRAVTDLSKLGERTIWLDCDVLEADGGTRTAAISGAFVALCDALHTLRDKLPPASSVVTDSVAAVSVGLLNGEVLLDLEYVEDRDADVDLNLVLTGRGNLVEVQGAGEEATFNRAQLNQLLDAGELGVRQITLAQKQSLGDAWPLGEW